MTLILAPDIGLVAWVHYAAALGDAFRKTYRQLLKWNDELPFVKFALAEQEDIVLSAEVAAADLDADAAGRAVARLLAVCDLLYDESVRFLGTSAGPAAETPGPHAPSPLLTRYAPDLAELALPEG